MVLTKTAMSSPAAHPAFFYRASFIICCKDFCKYATGIDADRQEISSYAYWVLLFSYTDLPSLQIVPAL